MQDRPYIEANFEAIDLCSRKIANTFYRTTILSAETDPNRLHDLKATLDGYQVYDPAQIDQLVALHLSGADCDRLDRRR